MVQIAVSGGGIAGMAAALAAARSGHEVTLFSGSRPAALVGGLQLAPNGWAALRDLGLEDEAERQSIRLTEITVRSLGTGSTLIRLPLHDPYASFDRAVLAGLLRNALAAEGTVSVREVNLEHIHQLDDGVRLFGEDGKGDSFAGLIAADGGHGPGRRYVTASQAVRGLSAKLAMRAHIPLSSLPAHFALPSSNLWLGRGMHVVHYPIGDMLNLVVTLPSRAANRGWQRRVFPATSPLAPLAEDSIRWTQTPLAAANMPIAGAVAALSLRATPRTACRRIWHRAPARGFGMPPASHAGLTGRGQSTRLLPDMRANVPPKWPALFARPIFPAASWVCPGRPQDCATLP